MCVTLEKFVIRRDKDSEGGTGIMSESKVEKKGISRTLVGRLRSMTGTLVSGMEADDQKPGPSNTSCV